MRHIPEFCGIRCLPAAFILLIFLFAPVAVSAASGETLNATTTSEPSSSLADEDDSTQVNWFASLWSDICCLFGARVDEAPSDLEAPPTLQPDNSSPSVSPSGTETVAPVSATDAPRTSSNLTVLSEPDGALISVDGEYTGRTTPAIFYGLSPGSHAVSLSIDGATAAFDADLSLSGDQTLTVNLSADSCALQDGLVEDGISDDTGSIYVDSNPDDAIIVLDGKKLQWRTPQVVSGIKPGVHTVGVTGGWVDFPISTEKCLVESGKVTGVVFDQEQHSTRSVTVTSEVFNKAGVTVDGTRLNLKIPATVTVSDISSFVSVRDDTGYYSFPVSASLDDGAEIELEEPAPATAAVKVISEPAGADISVDGFDTGYATPYTIENVSNGPHVIAVSRPGYLPSEQRILLTDDPGAAEDATLSFVLEDYPDGSLTVTSTSDGAKIYLYGKDTGEVTPHTFRYLRIGTYTVKVISGGESRSRDDVTVLPGGDTMCQFDL